MGLDPKITWEQNQMDPYWNKCDLVGLVTSVQGLVAKLLLVVLRELGLLILHNGTTDILIFYLAMIGSLQKVLLALTFGMQLGKKKKIRLQMLKTPLLKFQQ
jgi:hypothetical protein